MQIDRSFLAEAIHDSASSVFLTMLDSCLRPLSHGAEEMDGGVVSLIGLTGKWRGSASLSCTPATASRIASRMLMADLPESDSSITDEIMDAVGELTNIVVGNMKNSLEEVAGPIAISIPTVIFGRNFQFKSMTEASELRIPYMWETTRIDVRVSLAPAPDRYPAYRNRVAQWIAA